MRVRPAQPLADLAAEVPLGAPLPRLVDADAGVQQRVDEIADRVDDERDRRAAAARPAHHPAPGRASGPRHPSDPGVRSRPPVATAARVGAGRTASPRTRTPRSSRTAAGAPRRGRGRRGPRLGRARHRTSPGRRRPPTAAPTSKRGRRRSNGAVTGGGSRGRRGSGRMVPSHARTLRRAGYRRVGPRCRCVSSLRYRGVWSARCGDRQNVR